MLKIEARNNVHLTTKNILCFVKNISSEAQKYLAQATHLLEVGAGCCGSGWRL